MTLAETIVSLEKAEQERKAKRQEMEQLTFSLLSFDSESLGDAVKCYISEEKDTSLLSDAAYKAFHSIAEILVLEMEC